MRVQSYVELNSKARQANLEMENLEFNPLFLALQNEFSADFENAQERGCLVFIPTASALKSHQINTEFVSVHLAKPSPFFQGEYVVNDGRSTDKVIRIESNLVKRSADFQDRSEIKILGQEAGYSKSGKAFSIFVINKPLQTFGLVDICSGEVKESSVCQSWLDGSQCPSVAQCKFFISSFDNGNILSELDKKLETLLKNYYFLSEYLAEIAEKLRRLIDSTIETVIRKQPALGPKTITALPICIEGYVMSVVEPVLFPIICQRFESEDERLSCKLKSLHQVDVTPSQLGALELFSCPVPASIVELARLPSLTTPREQLQCVKNTIDLISAEIKQHLLESRGFLSFPDGLPCVTTDDLIPALSTTVVKAKLSHLSAVHYYMETFLWSVSSKDVYGYSLASFKASIEFLKSLEPQLLPPSNANLKKELSLEELMEVAGKLDEVRRGETTAELNASSTVDRQMEKIARMIEASTRELTQVQHQGFSSF